MESFRAENLNPHCFMNFRVQDEHGRIVGQSRNLAELRTKYRDQVAARFQSARIVPADAPAPKKGARGEEGGAAKAPGTPAPPSRRRLHRLELRPAARAARGEGGRPRDRRLPALHDDGASVSLRPSIRPKEAAKEFIAAASPGCSRWSSRPR
jgi:ATP-dependent helicase HrpA